MHHLSEAEDRRRQFQLMLEAAEREADSDGVFSLEMVLAEVDGIIGEAETQILR